jgi:hypothetical protein
VPLIPLGLGEGLLRRVKERVETELGAPLSDVKQRVKERVLEDPRVKRITEELGLAPLRRPPPSGPGDILLRVREAVRRDPPRLCHALYQAEDADTPTWRHLACYSIRDRGTDGSSLLFAACEKDRWKVEAFRLDRFTDFQVTTKPWPFAPKFRIEFRDGD